ncbi:MAG TPA: histidinol dehydrogenase [Candidatus Acidoferrales bacterium]|nr:histidinol dehydrogenase [Candidatus Acidoferrales bacterium]
MRARILGNRRDRTRAAERAAAKIIADVRRRGDAALFAWAKRFDRVNLDKKSLWVTPAELREAARGVPSHFLASVNHAVQNIRAVARRQRPQEWNFEVERGVRVGQRVQPIERVGCYLPGGRFSLVSTLLMTAIPAQEAGVGEIVVTSPQPGAPLLAAAALLGVRRIARIGGAQAIAALAYGTESIPRVDKICGPGNRFVAAAKRLVSADCSIDMLAGPTEAVIFAEGGDQRLLGADLIAQAEHDPDAISIFVTTSAKFAVATAAEIERQLVELPPANLARRSLRQNGFVLIAPNAAAAVRFVNEFAPEHLTLAGRARGMLKQIHSAGSIFLGDWSAQPAGDYASGTNHVLPTGGAARSRGGLSTADFVKCISVQELSRQGMRRLAPVVEAMAAAEGLEAHRRAGALRR